MASSEAPALRIDRWLTLRVVAPLSRGAAAADSDAIPILMYHSIAADVDDTLHPYFRTVTTPASFERQVSLLRQLGYRGTTLSAAVDGAHRAASGPAHATAVRPRPVVLTFDDGFRDFYTTACPILERAGFGATMFVASAYLGKRFINGRECLRPADVIALSRNGIEFGSHSASHPRLVELSRQALVDELVGSKRAIEDLTGKEVTLFSYPYRFPEENLGFTRLLEQLLDASGYRAGVTTAIGRWRTGDNPRFLPRLPINDCDDAPLMRAKLDGHYDWLRSAQRMRKRSRAWLRRWSPR